MSISTPQSLAIALEQLEIECKGLEFANAHYELGKVAELRGQFENAVRHYERATSYREEPEYLEALGTMKLKLGLEKQAIEVFERLLMCDDQPETHLTLAEALVKNGGRSSEAIRHLKAAAEASSQDPIFYKKLGRLCLVEALEDVAANVFERALALAPEDGSLWLDLARACVMSRRYEEAFSHLDRSISLEPTNADARIVYGDLLLSLRRWNDAAQKFREASELDPNSLAALLGEADASFEAGCYEDAAALYKKLTAVNGSDIRPFIGLAGALSQLKLHGEAVKVLEACRLNDTHHQLSFNLGVAYLETNDLVKAEVAFLDAVIKNPRDPLSRYYLQRIWAQPWMSLE